MKNRRIARVTFASLVAGGVSACGGGDSDIETLASLSCQEYQCEEPSFFAEDYSSLAECKRDLTAEFNAYLDEYRAYYGAACTSAILKYEICQNRYDLAYCTDGESNVDCSDEYARYLTACVE